MRKLKSCLVIRTIYTVSIYLISNNAFPDDITIINGQTVSITQSSTSDGDSINIEDGGTVSVNGVDGVSVTNNQVSVNNNGSINTTGNSLAAIFGTGNNGSVNNSGSINLSGGNLTAGIDYSGINTNINNSGSIIVNGTNSFGIITTGNNSIIVNSGSIIASGTNVDGISVSGDNSNINNSGLINTNGNDADGIFASGNNISINNSGSINSSGSTLGAVVSTGSNVSITNDGSINISATNAAAIDASGANARISNNGSISASGSNVTAILLDQAGSNNNILNNRGFITATGTGNFAIQGGNGQQTLNLYNDSIILGAIDLGGGTDIVNILGSFPSTQLTLSNVETINVASGITAVVNGNTVTTIDSTGESLRSINLASITTGLHNIVSRRMNQTKQLKPIQLAAAKLSSGMLFQQREPIVWGEVFAVGREREAEGSVLAHEHDYYGFTGAYERDYKNARVGLLGGFASSELETKASSIQTDTASFFAGGFGHWYLGPINLTTSLVGGYENHDNIRTVFDNINGIENASAGFESYFLSPSITFSSTYKLSSNVEIRPSTSLIYTTSWYDGYSESGTTSSNLMVDDRTSNVFSSRFELSSVYHYKDVSEFSVRTGIKTRHVDDDTIQASLAGTNFRFSSNVDDDVFGGFIGANVRYAIKDHMNFVSDIEYTHLEGSEDEVAFRISLNYLF